MKLAPTNQQINFLICAKTCKNASLSNGAKMTELKNLRNEALKGTGLATSWDDEGDEALEPLQKNQEGGNNSDHRCAWSCSEAAVSC